MRNPLSVARHVGTAKNINIYMYINTNLMVSGIKVQVPIHIFEAVVTYLPTFFMTVTVLNYIFISLFIIIIN